MIFVLIVLILLFVPIPIALKVSYADRQLSVRLWGFKVMSRCFCKKDDESSQKKPSRKKKTKKSKFPFAPVIKNVACSKFKPWLRFNLHLEYGLSDAANTAITFGILHSFYPLLQALLAMFLRVKKFKVDTFPNFDEQLVRLDIKSIFFINFANIIYMMFLIIPTLIREKNARREINAEM